jgi:hypothetical protein
VDPGSPQGLIDIYIPQSGQEGLIQQERFELPLTALQHFFKRSYREGGR